MTPLPTLSDVQDECRYGPLPRMILLPAGEMWDELYDELVAWAPANLLVAQIGEIDAVLFAYADNWGQRVAQDFEAFRDTLHCMVDPEYLRRRAEMQKAEGA